MSDRQNRWVATFVLLAGLAFAGGCGSTAAEVPEDNPAQVEPIAGSDRSQVILTEEGAGRVGIQTQPIGLAADGSSSVIALAAVLYDKDGKTWTYTTSEPLTFVPEQVVIARIDGDTAILTSGPAPGTEVVTVGAAELLGAEYGVPGE
jgi:hypothetical protein